MQSEISNLKSAIQPMLVFVLMSSALCFGQTAPGAGAGAPTSQTQRQNLQTALPTNGRAVAAAAMMQQTNGSLLAAQLATRPDPAQVKPSQVSFFAVAAPTPKTLKVHDLLTIVVQEQTQITSTGSKKTSRDSELDAKVTSMVALKLKSLTVKGLQANTAPEINLSGIRSFQGTGEVDRADSYTSRITGEVVDVKPNGTLIIEARKRIKTDEEEQQFVLTGTCRVEDIATDNSIVSTQLYDLQLTTTHKGDIKTSTDRGLIGKLLDVFNLF
jgi:flagellar L-ring protein precursor FlgH